MAGKVFGSVGQNGQLQFLWGGEVDNVAASFGFLQKPKTMATWEKITNGTHTCETFNQGYYFERVTHHKDCPQDAV